MISLTPAWKGKAAAADEDVDMDDLFDDSVAELPTGGGDRAARRAEYIGRIMNPSHGREEHRAGNLRKVVQLSDSPEELEQLGGVIQQWRVNGYAVSKQTSTEIVGRCINLGRVDLAEKYYRNRADCESDVGRVGEAERRRGARARDVERCGRTPPVYVPTGRGLWRRLWEGGLGRRGAGNHGTQANGRRVEARPRPHGHQA